MGAGVGIRWLEVDIYPDAGHVIDVAVVGRGNIAACGDSETGQPVEASVLLLLFSRIK